MYIPCRRTSIRSRFKYVVNNTGASANSDIVCDCYFMNHAAIRAEMHVVTYLHIAADIHTWSRREVVAGLGTVADGGAKIQLTELA